MRQRARYKLYVALSSYNASTQFKSEIVKINVYPIIFDKVLNGNLLETLHKIYISAVYRKKCMRMENILVIQVIR